MYYDVIYNCNGNQEVQKIEKNYNKEDLEVLLKFFKKKDINDELINRINNGDFQYLTKYFNEEEKHCFKSLLTYYKSKLINRLLMQVGSEYGILVENSCHHDDFICKNFVKCSRESVDKVTIFQGKKKLEYVIDCPRKKTLVKKPVENSTDITKEDLLLFKPFINRNI